QLQNLAIPGLAAEGRPVISYTEIPVRLSDGEVVMLRKPAYAVADLNYGPVGADTTLSARIAMPTLGLGLIEAISDADILAKADPDDKNGDGIA
ncbi:di-heme oxidoredictase family protein, partial [Escherichia coli]|uniref:di-heme oxidoredictase family protein n=2 Tax=Pseudomonadota TaxID=1224 RepID=UPI001F4AC4F0